MKKNPKMIIIGGGPAGLGAAYRLRDLGYRNWVLYEKNNYFGGQSATHVDENGFLWDEGGHVLHSHYKYFDKFIDKVLGKDYFEHQRESWIRLSDVWVPYPFQNNIRHLKKEDQLKCIFGLLEVNRGDIKSKNFKEWILSVFGRGIADLFLSPHNLKVWTIPVEKMSVGWMADRVSLVDVKRVLENIILEKDDVSWGPNNVFKFPKRGGTGEIYRRGAELIKNNLHPRKEVARIDIRKKIITFNDGETDSYDYLINTIPLDKFVRISDGAPADIGQSSKKLVYNSLLLLGIGIEKKIETSKCWVYFPEEDAPFFRLSFFHNYSRYNVPEGNVEKYSSVMCDISYPRGKSMDTGKIVRDSIGALIRHGIIEEADRKKIISKSVYDVPYSYPIPTVDRDKNLKKIQPFLMKNSIYSRGRFGAWKYEIGNMDHSFMQGVEAVDKILNNKKETIWSL